MNWSRNRIIVAWLLTAALGLMLCPPWLGAYRHGHRLLWNGRGNIDWSRLALELCLVAIVGALAAVVAPIIGRLSPRALRVWFRRAGLVLGCAAVLILAATIGYDGIARFTVGSDYNRQVQEFQAKAPVLQEAFPLEAATHSLGPRVVWDDKKQTDPADWIVVNPISNVHEAEIMLRSLGCTEDGIQHAMARFLFASTTGRDAKTLAFVIASPGSDSGSCPARDIFDRIAAKAGNAGTPPIKGTRQAAGDIDPSAGLTAYREIEFYFQIRDEDSAKRFFAPLPDWHTEALEHNIEVARVPDWMKPGEPPAS